jgi:hypothetical protein
MSVARPIAPARTVDAVEIAPLVERSLIALQGPDGLREAIHDPVLRLVGVSRLLQQMLIQPPDARRLIDTQLIEDGDVQTHVQEGVRFAMFGQEIPLQGGIGIADERLVFGVLAQDLDDLRLDRLEGFSGSGLLPSGDEDTSVTLAIVGEHGCEGLDVWARQTSFVES